jgi:hypothetical protein
VRNKVESSAGAGKILQLPRRKRHRAAAQPGRQGRSDLPARFVASSRQPEIAEDLIPKQIMNVADVSLDATPPTFAPTGPAVERFEARAGVIGARIGARNLGYNITAVPPGKRAWPFHTGPRSCAISPSAPSILWRWRSIRIRASLQ